MWDVLFFFLYDETFACDFFLPVQCFNCIRRELVMIHTPCSWLLSAFDSSSKIHLFESEKESSDSHDTHNIQAAKRPPHRASYEIFSEENVFILSKGKWNSRTLWG